MEIIVTLAMLVLVVPFAIVAMIDSVNSNKDELGVEECQ